MKSTQKVKCEHCGRTVESKADGSCPYCTAPLPATSSVDVTDSVTKLFDSSTIDTEHALQIHRQYEHIMCTKDTDVSSITFYTYILACIAAGIGVVGVLAFEGLITMPLFIQNAIVQTYSLIVQNVNIAIVLLILIALIAITYKYCRGD
jgi:hypothetical protein